MLYYVLNKYDDKMKFNVDEEYNGSERKRKGVIWL